MKDFDEDWKRIAKGEGAITTHPGKRKRHIGGKNE